MHWGIVSSNPSGNNDAQVQGTNDDAQLSKMSCVKLGYFSDYFIKYFVRRPARRAPLINRGYYSRYAALRGLLHRFLALPGPQHGLQAGKAAGSLLTSTLSGQQELRQPQPPMEEQQGTGEPLPPLPRPLALAQQQQQQAQQAQQQQPHPQQAQHQQQQQQPHNSGAAGDPPGPRQVLSLGAGFDTAFFQLSQEGRAPARFIELDFQEVTSRKAAIIQQTPALLQCLGDLAECSVDVERGRVLSPHYCLLPVDLRDLSTLEAALQGVPGFDPSLPTFVLSECVLVYMEPEQSAAVVKWLGSHLHCAAMAIYEQIRPSDAFGQQMLLNLEARGCALKGIVGTPDLEAQQRRFMEGGWDRAEARSMDDIYRWYLEPGDKRRIERLEIFDEFEEWDLIQAHYCIALGVKDSSGLLQGFGFQRYAPAQLPPFLQRPVG